ncbi:unnamed protein product [Schistosoma curassoni]|uniref:Gamma-glutamylcyclotransferase family protein n=1 Tax=Schistosoma curassoni TaxID=6186 RepID=A0A183K891_9TREM|nr:unnamed protein product [Schistosoma curassoni]
MFLSCKYAALALPIRAITSASDPPSSSMMLPKYVKFFVYGNVNQQQSTVGENKPDYSRGRNQEEVLEVDRTHIEECTELRHKTSPHMESSGSKEKWKTNEHITPRNGDRHEKNEQKLDRTGKGGPGQSGLENAGQRPMLHWE